MEAAILTTRGGDINDKGCHCDNLLILIKKDTTDDWLIYTLYITQTLIQLTTTW